MADPEIAASQVGMQVAQKHAGSLLMGVIIVLGIVIIFISFIAMAIAKAPHTASWVGVGIGAFLAIGGFVGVFFLEKNAKNA